LKLLITFETIGAALDFEKVMKDKQLPIKIIPTPRCLGVTCSYSALIDYQQHIDISDFLQTNGVAYSKLYQIVVNDKGHEVYEAMEEGGWGIEQILLRSNGVYMENSNDFGVKTHSPFPITHPILQEREKK
jgi:hypothetical protein